MVNNLEKKSNKGVSLIALVVTISILVALSLITVNMALGRKGLIGTAERAKIEYTHSSVWDGLTTEHTAFMLKERYTFEGTFIEYLQSKNIVSTWQVSGGYVINTKALLGESVELGNGTDGKDDVYKLEEVRTSIYGRETRLASNGAIKNADIGIENKQYKVKYYGKSGERELGRLINNGPGVENEEMHALKVGDYVQLPYNGEILECMIIYDDEYNEENGTNYGMQMITTDTVGDGVTFGGENVVELYNNAIEILNEEARKYLNESNNRYVKSVRCVGSVPNNPDEESEDYIEIYGTGVNVKRADSNYESDLEQLWEMKDSDYIPYMTKSGESYWLASRGRYGGTVFCTYGINYTGYQSVNYSSQTIDEFFDVYNGDIYTSLYTRKIRPVFTLNTRIPDRLYGSGTQKDPYRWTEDVK